MEAKFKASMLPEWSISSTGITFKKVFYPFEKITNVVESSSPNNSLTNGVIEMYINGTTSPLLLAYPFKEKEQAKADMGKMLDYIDKLNELDTSNVEPMSHVFPVQNVFREDVVENGDGGEDTLANAPERRDRAFVVPKTVE